MLAAGGAGGGMMSDGFTGVAQSVSMLKDAQANGVKLDPEAANALIASINNGIQRVNDALQERYRGGYDELKIGSSPGAELYRPVYKKVMSDPVQGAEKALENLRSELKDAVETVKACVRDTERTDNGSAHGFGNITT